MGTLNRGLAILFPRMNLADSLNQFVSTELRKEQRKEHPLHEWPSELLVWLFWSDEIHRLDPSDKVIEMIHAEMNARGEGERVSV